METKEQYMVTPVMDFAETVKMVEEMKKNAEANVAFANQLKANIVTLQESVQQDVASYSNKTCHHLTANQKRARAIEMAKEFVEDSLETFSWMNEIISSETTIDSEKRKVKFKLSLVNGKRKGKAKCKKGEVFNEHIGEAIALAKALDIIEKLPPDILKAVQPDSMVPGHVIYPGDDTEIEVITGRNWKGECYTGDIHCYMDHSLSEGLKIIDDTNADYSLQGGEN
ncbi:hypothetical protein ACFSY7_15580 [Kurthia populi]|uniref:Phage protein n=1 Tax=Kurthia populi TaxID=1562132 RepID=A0ABW5Y4K3_9BACL